MTTMPQQASRKRKAGDEPNSQAKQRRVNDSKTSVTLAWLPQFQLTKQHRRQLLENRRLADEHINAFQRLISHAIVSQGWQHVTVGHIGYEFAPAPSIQIMHNENNHWLVSASTVHGIFVADSLLTVPNLATQRQLLQLYSKPGESNAHINVTYLTVQRQQGVTQCGDFAIAFAAAFASRQSVQDIGKLRFDQGNMRSHMMKCLTTETFSQFPLSSHCASLFETTLLQDVKYRIDKLSCSTRIS